LEDLMRHCILCTIAGYEEPTKGQGEGRIVAANTAKSGSSALRWKFTEDQVTGTRRTIKQMNDAADRAIDEQVVRSTPMTPKKIVWNIYPRLVGKWGLGD
jgi:hypothetical protein